MFSVTLKSILTLMILFITFTAFPYDISCKDEKGKQTFTLNFEKPLSSQISNKLGMKTAVLKGLNDLGERYSFIANTVIEENTDENHNLTLSGFGQVTGKPVAGKQINSSLKSIIFLFSKRENILNLGKIEFVSVPFLQMDEQKIEYLNCHFDGMNSKEIKIYSRILESFKIKR
jgi:hypothetical protein